MVGALRGVIVSMALAAGVIGAAIPASATPPPDGNYEGTVTDTGGSAGVRLGNKERMHLSSCGDGCIHIRGRRWSAEIHPQGGVWSGPASTGDNVWFDEETLAGGVDGLDGTHIKTQMSRS